MTNDAHIQIAKYFVELFGIGWRHLIGEYLPHIIFLCDHKT